MDKKLKRYVIGFIVSLCITFILSTLTIYRTNNITELRDSVLMLNYEYGTQNKTSRFEIYNKLPTFYKMVLSTKSAEMEDWLSEEDIKKLRGVK